MLLPCREPHLRHLLVSSSLNTPLLKLIFEPNEPKALHILLIEFVISVAVCDLGRSPCEESVVQMKATRKVEVTSPGLGCGARSRASVFARLALPKYSRTEKYRSRNMPPARNCHTVRRHAAVPNAGEDLFAGADGSLHLRRRDTSQCQNQRTGVPRLTRNSAHRS